MRRQQSFTVKAAAGAPATAAVPVEADGVDISTYRYLDELWAAALLQAEASVLALPHTGSSGLQGAKHTSEADNAGRKETSIKQAADKTGVSSMCNESLLTATQRLGSTFASATAAATSRRGSQIHAICY
ncbi:hypothetical protein CGC20_7585 [Leishmania donovani]|uniref:Uncharacterized protein n=1 Tax=Leishmania donovani TaxID=5661 RepID=A0A504X580_LEIDO|nr:hypothetical protein CGC20_7585 [Leishmania donovani]